MNIKEIVDNFESLDDWEDRYSYLIDLGKAFPRMEDALKTEENRVKGCMSQVWMVMGWSAEKKLVLIAESDAQIVQGLVAVLRIIFEGKSFDEIKNIDIDQIFKKLALDRHLSPNRRNGFYAMVEKIRAFTSALT